ncbi:MAG TPA: carboxylesterase [Rhodanobacteraceae bacterium]|nr:carboxylesterase [Rhodanobacteraceae bacterium]
MDTLPTVESETGADPRYSILWLHGLGADGNDFSPIVPELVAEDWPALRFVFPHAPVRPVTVNGGMAMRAWYDIAGIDIASRQDEMGIRASIVAVEALIAREVERGVPCERIFLAGFSQGGAIALAAGLRHAAQLAGIIALSTYLPLHEKTVNELADGNRDTAIFQAHGTADPVVAPTLGTMTRDWLREAGYHVDWHDYPMGHQVCAEEIADLRAWLSPRLQD